MVKRIAVLRALHVGDFLCAEPALRALKGRYPLAEITLIGLPWIEPLLPRYRCIDRFLAFPGYPGIQEVPYDPATTEAFLAKARSLQFDLAVQMHGSGPESNDFIAALEPAASLGYAAPGAPCLLTRAVPYPGDRVHEVKKWLALVAHVGATGPARPELPVLPAEAAEAGALLASLSPRRPIVALHAGSRDAARRWPPERFAALADQLWDTQGCQIVLTGTPSDAEVNSLVCRVCRAPVLDLTGKTSLGTLAALLERVDLLVTNDSGPSHVAWARRVPSVILFGPTDPARWAPLDGVLHRAVKSPGHNLRNLGLADVWPAVAEGLALARRKRRPS